MIGINFKFKLNNHKYLNLFLNKKYQILDITCIILYKDHKLIKTLNNSHNESINVSINNKNYILKTTNLYGKHPLSNNIINIYISKNIFNNMQDMIYLVTPNYNVFDN